MARTQNGRHNSKARIDARGRVSIPKSVRKHLGVDKGDSVVIARDFNQKKCITLYTVEEWKDLESRFQKLIYYLDEEPMDYLRVLIGDIDYQEIDDMGRILLPGNFIDYADLKKDVVFVKMPGKVEIWDEEIWREEERKIFEKMKTMKISDLLRRADGKGGNYGEGDTQAGNG